MEYVQERIATLHAYDDPRPALPDGVVVVVPLRANDVLPATRATFRTLAEVEPAHLIVPVRGDQAAVAEISGHLDRLSFPTTVLWCNAPAMDGVVPVDARPAEVGKGFDVWLGIGVAAEAGSRIVVHDGDNTAYSPAHVPRLAWPLAHGFDFAKGYYARVENDRLYGRVTRLLAVPLIETIRRETGHDLAEYLAAFRYPLAGEYALSAEVATSLPLLPGFGLEMSLLSTAFHHVGFTGTAQVDLGWHRHEHRPVSGPGGLETMGAAVIAAVRDAFERVDAVPAEEHLRERYEAVAREHVAQFAGDAAFNDLAFDREGELSQIDRYGAQIPNATPIARLPPFAAVNVDPGEIRRAGRIDAGESCVG